MRRLLVISLAVAIGFGITALGCGGGNGGGGSSSAPPVVNESASGFWNGHFYSQITNERELVSGLITEDNELRFASTTWGGQYAGMITSSGNSLTGNITAYAPWGYVFWDGSTVGTVRLNATVQTRVSISGTYEGVGDRGTFLLAFDSVYLRPSSLSLVQGNWRHSGINLGTINMAIDANGNINGITSGGCVYAGKISIINASYNAYRVSLNITSCGSLNGAYNGLASLDDTSSQNDTILMSVSNASNAFTAGFIRR